MNLLLPAIKVRMVNLISFIISEWRYNFYIDNSKPNFQTFYEAKRKFMKMSVEGFNLPAGKKAL